MKNKNKNKKGFTLIELLVVIAIIGILSSVVVASLNSARKKARDAKRVSEIINVRTALMTYFDSNKAYPAGPFATMAATLVASGDLTALPKDPLSPAQEYKYCASAATGALSYNMAAILEDDKNDALSSDADINVATCVSGETFNGTASTTYDVKP